MSNPKKCFVLSPIGEDSSPERKAADRVLKHLIGKALGDEYEVSRADGDTNPGAITPRIVSSILEADLVIADLSGHNPNVFYELAIAHGFRRPVVHIQKTGEKAAFDVKDMRIVRYDVMDPDALEDAQKRLSEFAKHAVEKPETVETPLSPAVKFAELEASADPVAESSVQIIQAINDLRYEVRRSSRGHGPLQETDRGRRDEIASLRSIVRRVVNDGRAKESDFSDTITPSTRQAHDDWVRTGLKKITGETSLSALNEILFDPETQAMAADGPDDFDESDVLNSNGDA